MIERVRNGTSFAVIGDDNILVPAAQRDRDCALHILDDEVEQFDLALAYKRTFNDSAFMRAVDVQISRMAEQGVLEVWPRILHMIRDCVHTPTRTRQTATTI